MTIFIIITLALIALALKLNLNELKKQTQLYNETMAKVSELAAQLNIVVEQLNKAKQEILDRIAALEAALTDVDLPAEAEAALSALQAAAQELDDIIPG